MHCRYNNEETNIDVYASAKVIHFSQQSYLILLLLNPLFVHRNAQGALQNLENPKDERKRISRFYRSGFRVPKQFSYTMMHDGFLFVAD
jgi:hypothetical protein